MKPISSSVMRPGVVTKPVRPEKVEEREEDDLRPTVSTPRTSSLYSARATSVSSCEIRVESLLAAITSDSS